MSLEGSSKIWMGDEDEEGWSEALGLVVCAGLEGKTNTMSYDSITWIDSSATVSMTDSGMVFCWV